VIFGPRAMLYRLARALQLVGLLLLPIAVAGNLAEAARVENALSLKDTLLLSAAGIGCFAIGWFLQQQVRPK
jgi:hypothetical protein